MVNHIYILSMYLMIIISTYLYYLNDRFCRNESKENRQLCKHNLIILFTLQFFFLYQHVVYVRVIGVTSFCVISLGGSKVA